MSKAMPTIFFSGADNQGGMMKHAKISRRTTAHASTGTREMNRTLQNEVQRSDLEALEQQRIDHETRMRKFAEASNTRDPGKGWVDTRH
jgi:hypothetical protein